MSTDKVLKAIRDVVEAFDELPSHHPARYAHLNINGLRAILATPPAQAQGVEAVHQFRTAHCSDWYDGYPDFEDGGGPYEQRTLYRHPSTLKRLSPEQIMLLSGNCYDIGGENPVVVFARAIESASAAHNGMGVE